MRSTWQDDFRQMLNEKVPINSLGMRQEWVEDKLNDKVDIRLEHLLKLYFYPEGTQYHGVWMRSVFSSTSRVWKFKRGNNFPGKDFIYRAIWLNSDPTDIRDRMGSDVEVISIGLPLLQAPEFPLDSVVVDDCMQYMQAYHDGLAGVLSKRGYVISPDVYGEVRALLVQSIYHK